MAELVPTRRAKYLTALLYVDLARNSIAYAFPASAHRRRLAGAPAMLAGMSIGASFHSWRRGDDLAHTPALLLMFAAAVAARFHGAQFLPLIHGGLFGGPTLTRLPRELRPAAGMLPFALGMAAIAAIAIVLSRMLASVSQRSAASAQPPHC